MKYTYLKYGLVSVAVCEAENIDNSTFGAIFAHTHMILIRQTGS